MRNGVALKKMKFIHMANYEVYLYLGAYLANANSL